MFVIICFHYDVSQVDDAYANIILMPREGD